MSLGINAYIMFGSWNADTTFLDKALDVSALTVDAGLTFVPFVPTFAGSIRSGLYLAKSARAVDKVHDAEKLLDTAAEGAKSGEELVKVRHYTNNSGRDAINANPTLRADTYVTLPEEISPKAGHLQIESRLEIEPGRGTNYIEVEVPRKNLRIPDNGPRTGGGALQFQLNDRTPIDPTVWRRPPGRPTR